jgi:hypothetical protein
MTMKTYTPEAIHELSVKAIKENPSIFFIEDLISLLPCKRATFYSLFPSGSEGLDSLKELIDRNKISKKLELRKSFAIGSSAERIALYRLIATNEERRALSTHYIEQDAPAESDTTPNELVIAWNGVKQANE